jgi:FHA domain
MNNEASLVVSTDGLRCTEPGCATVLAADAELCDECGSQRLMRLSESPAVLIGAAGDRPVAFELPADGRVMVGRASSGATAPDIDLTRLPGSATVHRQHAEIAPDAAGWRVTQLGRNPLVIRRPGETVVVEPGTSQPLRAGDRLLVGGVSLQVVVMRQVTK